MEYPSAKLPERRSRRNTSTKVDHMLRAKFLLFAIGACVTLMSTEKLQAQCAPCQTQTICDPCQIPPVRAAAKVPYTAICTYEENGETIVVATTGYGIDATAACENGKQKLMNLYPDKTLVCEPCPPRTTDPASTASPVMDCCDPCQPWTVTYTCKGSDGKTYKFTSEGTSFRNALNTARCELCKILSARCVTCCSACYTIVKQPCPKHCRPLLRLLGR